MRTIRKSLLGTDNLHSFHYEKSLQQKLVNGNTNEEPFREICNLRQASRLAREKKERYRILATLLSDRSARRYLDSVNFITQTQILNLQRPVPLLSITTWDMSSVQEVLKLLHKRQTIQAD